MVGAALSSCWGLAAVWRENRKWQRTSIAGRGHGTDGVCGDEVPFAEAGEPLLHESDESVDGILLLASAQRHALRTQMHTNQMLGLTLFQSAISNLHRPTARLTREYKGVPGSSPASTLALWTMSSMVEIHLSTPTSCERQKVLQNKWNLLQYNTM